MKLKIGTLVVTAVGIISGYTISNPLIFNLCSNTYQFNGHAGCLDESIMHIGSPLFIFSLWIGPIVVIVCFLSEKIFISWLKLAAWMIPLALVFIATHPVSWNGIGLNFFFISRDDMARYAAELFSVASLILIVWKYFVFRPKSS